MSTEFTFVAGPTLLLVIAVIVGLTVYNAASKKKDEERARTAESTIRRCPSCGGLLGKEAETCRHCGTATPPAS